MTTNPVISITDEQIAEIEANCIDEKNRGHSLVIGVNQVAALISRLRAAERYAERYRWVSERGDAFQWENILGFDLDDFVCQDSALDAAIDAALTAAGVAYK